MGKTTKLMRNGDLHKNKVSYKCIVANHRLDKFGTDSDDKKVVEKDKAQQQS